MSSDKGARTFVVETVSGRMELPENFDDPEVRTAYMEGQCIALALELHKRTNYPLTAILSEPLHPEMTPTQMASVIAYSLHHVLVRAPGGIVVDIQGPRPLRQYLQEEDPGFAPDQYHGRDTDFLTEDEFHESDCLCLDQCYPNAHLSVAEVSAADLEYAVALGELVKPARRAAAHYASQLVKKFDLPRKVALTPSSRTQRVRERAH